MPAASTDDEDWEALADRLVTVNEQRTNERISIDDEKRNFEVFVNLFLNRLREKYKDTIGSTNNKELTFDISDVRKPIQKGGFGIEGFEEPFIIQTIGKLQRRGLIEGLTNRKFRITPNGLSRLSQ